MFVPIQAKMVYWGVLCRGFRLFGETLSVELGGLKDLRMVDGMMTLVDDVNLNGVSPLAREVLGLEAEGVDDLLHQTG